jgi:hypothetical protein
MYRDMSIQANVFNDTLQFYTVDSEAIRSAAAFASGASHTLYILAPSDQSVRQYMHRQHPCLSSNHRQYHSKGRNTSITSPPRNQGSGQQLLAWTVRERR